MSFKEKIKVRRFCLSMLNLSHVVKSWLPDSAVIFLNYCLVNRAIPNIWHPKTLNEKILWLKINDRRAWHSTYADKVAVKNVIRAAIGEQFNVPLLAVFPDVENAKRSMGAFEFPYIIKPNHDSGGGEIVRSKNDLDRVNWGQLHTRLQRNYYKTSREYQYSLIEPCLMVEKLLLTESGVLPSDYKVHVINGRAEFIYCSIDRLGENYRKIYNRDWVNFGMMWGPSQDLSRKFNGAEIQPPRCLTEMLALAEILARGFSYIRVDFYEVQGRLFVGELTQHQYGGYCPIVPRRYDYDFGRLLPLTKSPESPPF